MLIKKGETVIVKHWRKGTFRAKAYEAFDTDEKEFYPLVALETVYGAANVWYKGDKIEARKSLCIIEKEENK